MDAPRGGGQLPPRILGDQIAPHFHLPPQIFRRWCIPDISTVKFGQFFIFQRFAFNDAIHRVKVYDNIKIREIVSNIAIAIITISQVL